MNIEINKSHNQYNMYIKIETAREMHLFNNMFIVDDTVEYGQSPYGKFTEDNDIQCNKPYYHITNDDNINVYIAFPTLGYVESCFNFNNKDAMKVKKFILRSLKYKY